MEVVMALVLVWELDLRDCFDRVCLIAIQRLANLDRFLVEEVRYATECLANSNRHLQEHSLCLADSQAEFCFLVMNH